MRNAPKTLWFAFVCLITTTCLGQTQTRVPGGEPIRFQLPSGKLFSTNPRPADPDAKLFNFNYGDFEGVNGADPRANVVWTMGYNVSSGGGREDATEPALGIHWESYYVIGGVPHVEWHGPQFTGTDGVIRRPFSGAWPRSGSATGATTSVTGQVINLLDWAGVQKLKWDFTAGTADVFDGVVFRQENNNAAVWQQRNAADTAFINLPYISSDNRMRQETSGVFTGTIPTTGAWANEFFAIQATAATSGQEIMAILVPAVTGDIYATIIAGPVTGELRHSIFNSSNANANADAIVERRVGGTSAGDPMSRYIVLSGQTWAAGVDNSDSDKYKISNSADIGTGDCLTIDPTTDAVDMPLGYTGTKVVTNDTNGGTLTAAECRGQTYTNTGASGGQTFNLPPVTAGMTITVLLSAADDVNINPDNADQILVLTNAVGDAISSDAGQGHFITLIGIDSTNWMMLEHDGIWTDVN